MAGTYGDSNRYTSSTPHSCPLFPDALEGKRLHLVGPQKSTAHVSRKTTPARCCTSPGSGNPSRGTFNPTPLPPSGARGPPGRRYPPSRLSTNPDACLPVSSQRRRRNNSGTAATLAAIRQFQTAERNKGRPCALATSFSNLAFDWSQTRGRGSGRSREKPELGYLKESPTAGAGGYRGGGALGSPAQRLGAKYCACSVPTAAAD